MTYFRQSKHYEQILISTSELYVLWDQIDHLGNSFDYFGPAIVSVSLTHVIAQWTFLLKQKSAHLTYTIFHTSCSFYKTKF